MGKNTSGGRLSAGQWLVLERMADGWTLRNFFMAPHYVVKDGVRKLVTEKTVDALYDGGYIAFDRERSIGRLLFHKLTEKGAKEVTT